MIENRTNIVGSDVGNITTEVTTHKDTYIIESRIETATDLKTLAGAESFEIDNQRYVVGRGEFENNSFKYEKDNFIDNDSSYSSNYPYDKTFRRR